MLGVIVSDTAVTLPGRGLPPKIVDRIKMRISQRSNQFSKNSFFMEHTSLEAVGRVGRDFQVIR